MSLLTITSSPGTWVTTVMQQDTDIHDLGEWWDLRGTISMRRWVENLEPTACFRMNLLVERYVSYEKGPFVVERRRGSCIYEDTK